MDVDDHASVVLCPQDVIQAQAGHASGSCHGGCRFNLVRPIWKGNWVEVLSSPLSKVLTHFGVAAAVPTPPCFGQQRVCRQLFVMLVSLVLYSPQQVEQIPQV